MTAYKDSATSPSSPPPELLDEMQSNPLFMRRRTSHHPDRVAEPSDKEEISPVSSSRISRGNTELADSNDDEDAVEVDLAALSFDPSKARNNLRKTNSDMDYADDLSFEILNTHKREENFKVSEESGKRPSRYVEEEFEDLRVEDLPAWHDDDGRTKSINPAREMPRDRRTQPQCYGTSTLRRKPARTRVPPPVEAPPVYRNLIGIMGPTGAGKSSFINCVSGSRVMNVGHGSRSCTADVDETDFHYKSHIIKLVDTPGFDDTNLSDTEVLRRIANWMEFNYTLGVKLTGIIYLREITEARMKGSAVKNLDMMLKLCGTDALANVVLVTTKWDALQDEEIGREREKELREDFWKVPLQYGAKMERHNNTQDSALRVLSHALGNPEIVLEIQREIVDEKKSLVQTAAGAAINQEILLLEAKWRRELEDKLAEKDRTHSEIMRKINEDQQKELEAKLHKAEADAKALELSREAEMKDLKQQLQEVRMMAEKAGKSVVDYVWSGVSSTWSKLKGWLG
ncbi:MAG: hypothetical protein M1824_005962 [Vezdaea acicularis]|nr:MAG: hypothetical protein M1824_005962 [Vezdaea acicularis]